MGVSRAMPFSTVTPVTRLTPVTSVSLGSDASDLELIERAKRAEPVAMRLLYERYSKRVYTTVCRIAGDETLAEDCAQEAWVRAFRALPAFRGDSKFTTWLLRIAMNQALSTVRRRARRPAEDQLDTAFVAPAIERDVYDRRRLGRALARLPEGMRKILVMHDVQGFTHEEIAETMGNTPSTCRSQLFKARARMRELLGERDGRVADGNEETNVCNT
jgi:RNA polymerase sigma-70 factor (ECF subfamily)